MEKAAHFGLQRHTLLLVVFTVTPVSYIRNFNMLCQILDLFYFSLVGNVVDTHISVLLHIILQNTLLSPWKICKYA